MFVGDGSAWRYDNTGPVLSAGSTYHLVGTYDGTNARLYVNGALVIDRPDATMAPNGGANVMRFGAFSTGPGQYWPGTLDDASFYPGRPQRQPGAGALQTRASPAASRPRPRPQSSPRAPPREYVGAGGVGGGAGGADADCVDGDVVGDGTDLLRLPVAALQPGLRRYRRRDREHLPGRRRRRRRHAAGRRHRQQQAGSSEAISAQTAAVTARRREHGHLQRHRRRRRRRRQVSGIAARAATHPPARRREHERTASSPPAGGSRSASFQSPGRAPALRHLLAPRQRHRHLGQAAPARDRQGRRDNRALVGEWYDAANWPIDGADWTLNPGTNALAGADITALAVNATAELASRRSRNVSLTGYTGLRLGVNGGQPSGDNYVQIATLEHTSAPNRNSSSPTPPPAAPTAPVEYGAAGGVGGGAVRGRR